MKNIFKQSILTAALLLSTIAVAQVGINTDSPTVTLDIKGNPTQTNEYDGVIPPRITGEQLRAKTYGADQDGALIYVTLPDPNPQGQTKYVTQKGYYRFDYQKPNSTPNQGMWIAGFQTRKVYLLYEMDYDVAKDKVELTPNNESSSVCIYDSTRDYYECRKDLGYSLTLEVPANTELKVMVSYTLPVGFPYSPNKNGYYGVTFFKSIDGSTSEEAMASRKTAIISNEGLWSMSTIAGTYVEVINNTTNKQQTYTYTLKGYVEGKKDKIGGVSFRFNEYDKTGENYNWGRGSIVMNVFKLTQL